MRASASPVVALTLLLIATLCGSTATLAEFYPDLGDHYVPTGVQGLSTVFLSDVYSMTIYGEFFGVEVSFGRISRIALSLGGALRVARVYEDIVSPNLRADSVFYEFGGYYLKAYLGTSSYIQTHLVQRHRAFIHTVCIDRGFRLSMTIANGSLVKELDLEGLRAVVVFAEGFYTVLLFKNATVKSFSVDIDQRGARVSVEPVHICTTVVGVARATIEELEATLEGVSLELLYEELDMSRDLYLEYVKALPTVDIDAVQLKNLYYASLYNILNTFLYPEIHSRSPLDLVAAYTIALNVYTLSKPEAFRDALAEALWRLRLETVFEAFVGLALSRALGNSEALAEVCSRVQSLKPGGEAIERLFAIRILEMCGEEIGGDEIPGLLGLLKPEELLALLELELVSEDLVSGLAVKELPTPSTCWQCLSYAQAVRRAKPRLHELVNTMLSGNASSLCASYVVLRALAGVSVGRGSLALRPFVPMHVTRFNLRIFIDGRSSYISYAGWGETVKSVKLDGVAVDLVSIPTAMVREGSVIEVELAGKMLRLDIEVLDSGTPLENLPVYLIAEGLGVGYRVVSTTDSRGRTSFSVPARTFVTLAIEVPGAGWLQLRTWVGEEDARVTVDVSKVFNRLAEVESAVRALERRVLGLEANLSALASRRVEGRGETALSRIPIIFSVLALFSSVVALSLAMVEVRRRGG